MKRAPSGDRQDWKEWIFHESRRRRVILLHKPLQLTNNIDYRVECIAHIVNKFIDIGTAVRCTPFAGFALPPLPQKKVLWEAQNGETWRREFDITLMEK